MQPKLLDDINVECGCDKEDEDVPEEVVPAKKKSTLELSRAFHSIESTKDKILEAVSNLGFGQFSRASKRCIPCFISYVMVRRSVALLKLLLIHFYEEMKCSHAQCFLCFGLECMK